jgi:hypothetical protein
MATTFISPDFTNQPYAPGLNNQGRNNAGGAPVGMNNPPAAQPVIQAVAEQAPKGGFTDFIKENKVMVIIFVLVVVIIICILIWMMTRGKPKQPEGQGAPGPPAPQPRALPRGPPGQPMAPGMQMPQQGQPMPPQMQQQMQPPQPQMQPQQPRPQRPIPEMKSDTGGIETADDNELNRFMNLGESSESISDSEGEDEKEPEKFSVGGSEDDESDADNIGDSWSVESSDE